MNPIHTALIYAMLCALGHGMVLAEKGWQASRNGLVTGGLLLAIGLLSVLGSCCGPIIFHQHGVVIAGFMTGLYMLLSVLILGSAVCVTASRRTMDAAFSLMAFLACLSTTFLYSMPAWIIGVWDLLVAGLFILLVVSNAGFVGVSPEAPSRRWSHPITLATSLIGLFLIVGWVLPGSYAAKDYYTSLAKDNKVLGMLVTMIGLAGVLVHRHAALSLFSLGIIWCGVLLVADGVSMFWKSENRVMTLCFLTLVATLQIYLDGVNIRQGIEEQKSVTWRIMPHGFLGHRKVRDESEY